MKGDITKWRHALLRDNTWDSASHRKIQKKEAEVIISWLKKLNFSKYEIIEIGCGNGYLAKILITEFNKKNIEFTYKLLDILPECIEHSKRELRHLIKGNNITFGIVDAYKLDKYFSKDSCRIIISTGFASVASYKNVVPILSNLMKEDGILICDFINHFSPFIIIFKLKLLFKFFLKFNIDKHYHFGKFGIKLFFKNHNLILQKTKTISYKRNPIICMFKKSI